MKYDVAAHYDIVIIGSGISGLLCAIELGKNNKSVFIATKEAVTESSSLYAQGGMAVPLSELDSTEKHLEDTIKVGMGLCDELSAKKIIGYSKKAFERLVSMGVKFDLASDNTVHQTKEAAHSFPRVVHVGGDASGKFITKTLIDNACREPNISISQGTTALKILKKDERIIGVFVEDIAKNRYVVTCEHIIIATGGIGQIYKNTSNPKVSTGDGLIMAFNAGTVLQDLEMIQFHPTVLLEGGEPFLITEAIRGEGGRLKNINGEYFAKKYHELGELAPRDVLARGILNELEITKSKFVYLDVSNFSVDYFKDRFPSVFGMCVNKKIDLFNKGIPVAPAAHYFIGGIKTSVSGKTNIPSLWAVGECSSTGLHGANRLASNSLLECIAVPQFLVDEILTLNTKKNLNIDSINIETSNDTEIEKEIERCFLELRENNLHVLGPIRNGDVLKIHLNWLEEISKKFNVYTLSNSSYVQEFKNMILLSKLIAKAALDRENSIGVHFREDFQDPPKKYEHSFVKMELPASTTGF